MAMAPNPNEGCVGRIARGRRTGTMTQPPLGLNRRDGIGTQGSGHAATLGWRTQSLWDRGAIRPTTSSRPDRGGIPNRPDGRTPVVTLSTQLPEEPRRPLSYEILRAGLIEDRVSAHLATLEGCQIAAGGRARTRPPETQTHNPCTLNGCQNRTFKQPCPASRSSCRRRAGGLRLRATRRPAQSRSDAEASWGRPPRPTWRCCLARSFRQGAERPRPPPALLLSCGTTTGDGSTCPRHVISL